MVTALEVALLLVAVGFFFGAYRVIDAVKPFVVNAVVGIVALLLAQWLGVEVAITPVAILVTAVAGLPGAVLVVLLALLDVAFVPAAGLLPAASPGYTPQMAAMPSVVTTANTACRGVPTRR